MPAHILCTCVTCTSRCRTELAHHIHHPLCSRSLQQPAPPTNTTVQQRPSFAE